MTLPSRTENAPYFAALVANSPVYQHSQVAVDPDHDFITMDRRRGSGPRPACISASSRPRAVALVVIDRLSKIMCPAQNADLVVHFISTPRAARSGQRDKPDTTAKDVLDPVQ
jgi:hypothetical protein